MEMHELAKDISPIIMQEVFRFRVNIIYNLRSQSTFETFRNAVYNDTDSISYLGPNVRELVPDKLKSITLLPVSKKKWNSGNCLCRLYETYIQSVVLYVRQGLLLSTFLSGCSKIFVFAYVTCIAFRF